jgi:hypothetical protein
MKIGLAISTNESELAERLQVGVKAIENKRSVSIPAPAPQGVCFQ